MGKYIEFEDDIDLIVLSGDQITGNNCWKNCTEYYKLLAEFLTPYEIPWAVTFGNHDDMDYQTMSMNHSLPSQHTRQDLIDVLKHFPLDLTQEGPSTVFGSTNYVLDIYIPKSTSASPNVIEIPDIGAQIYIFDTGGGQLPQQTEQNQIDWFRKKQQEATNIDPLLPAVAFQHIPTLDFDYGGESDETASSIDYGERQLSPREIEQDHYEEATKCQGFRGQKLTPLQDGDAGIVQALSDSGNVHFLAVGHDHGNDYCCPYSDSLKLCFGRHSGYGGYGHWARGARLYELRLEANYGYSVPADNPSLSMSWESWVRLDSGKVISQVTSDS